MNAFEEWWDSKTRYIVVWSGCEDVAKDLARQAWNASDKNTEKLVATDPDYYQDLLKEHNE